MRYRLPCIYVIIYMDILQLKLCDLQHIFVLLSNSCCGRGRYRRVRFPDPRGQRRVLCPRGNGTAGRASRTRAGSAVSFVRRGPPTPVCLRRTASASVHTGVSDMPDNRTGLPCAVGPERERNPALPDRAKNKRFYGCPTRSGCKGFFTYRAESEAQ